MNHRQRVQAALRFEEPDLTCNWLERAADIMDRDTNRQSPLQGKTTNDSPAVWPTPVPSGCPGSLYQICV